MSRLLLVVSAAVLVAGTLLIHVSAQESPFVRKKSRLDMIAEGSLDPCPALRARDRERCRDVVRMAENDVTPSQVQGVIDDIGRAEPTLRAVWTEQLRPLGRPLAMPGLHFYGIVGALPVNPPNECGLELDNAFLCVRTNQIYFDAVFLAKAKVAVGRETGSSGTYAALTIAAHEMGHSATFQAGWVTDPTDVRYRELIADCFAGAVVAAANVYGTSLPPNTAGLVGWTPMSEGQLAMFFSGGTGATRNDYPTGEERRLAFLDGFAGGPPACAPDRFR
jgi:hypothetical protein